MGCWFFPPSFITLLSQMIIVMNDQGWLHGAIWSRHLPRPQGSCSKTHQCRHVIDELCLPCQLWHMHGSLANAKDPSSGHRHPFLPCTQEDWRQPERILRQQYSASSSRVGFVGSVLGLNWGEPGFKFPLGHQACRGL